MKISKKIAREFVFPAAMNFGIGKILRQLSSNSILNIMYHGVVPKTNPSFSPRHISSAQFEKHLKYFIKNFEILSLPEAFEKYRNNTKTGKKALTISFDDGYKNNLNYVLPLLEKYNIKTTFFISGVCAEKMKVRTLWTDQVACLSYFFRDEIIEIKNFRFVNAFDTAAKLSLSDYIKSLMPPDRESVLAFLTDKYGLNDKFNQIHSDYWELMNERDIQKLASSSVADIGSHGYLHYNLGIIGLSAAAEELKKSKELLESASNQNIDMIAFPDGSYTQEVKDLAEELGYDKQLAVNYQFKDDITDKRILNRHGLSSTTTFESNMLLLSKSFSSKGYN